jgi:phosphatidylinositol-3-phosphatase
MPESSPAAVGRIATCVILLLAVTACASSSDHRMMGAPCTGHARAAIRHVLWIWMENKPYQKVVKGDDAPNTQRYANLCGLATNYSAVTNPSLPNYIAATAGTLPGTGTAREAILDDTPAEELPNGRLLGLDNIFSQVSAHGRAWRSYEEDMPAKCVRKDAGLYAARHNPAVYYSRISASECARSDVPLGTATKGPFVRALNADSLPAFAFVTPNLCDDGHGAARLSFHTHSFHVCSASLETADTWLGKWLKIITASPAYESGTTAVFVTWDEGGVRPLSQIYAWLKRTHPAERGKPCELGTTEQRCHVVLLVISPAVRRCARSEIPFNHYSLLKTTEEILELPPLTRGEAVAKSMGTEFGLEHGAVGPRTKSGCI